MMPFDNFSPTKTGAVDILLLTTVLHSRTVDELVFVGATVVVVVVGATVVVVVVVVVVGARVVAGATVVTGAAGATGATGATGVTVTVFAYRSGL
jgi:hypothetical protein